MSFFGSNPFVTPVGQRIEKATSEGLASEDWGLNIEICDIINETEEGPKDAVKAVKKRLLGNKNWKEVMFALTVLETCVKNCGHRFHVLVCKQEFVKELVKIIQPNMNPPTVVQEKILSLIQSWADAFRTKPDLQGVVKVYEELRQKGIEFPATNLDELSPIVTPQRGTPEIDPGSRRSAPTRQNAPPPMPQQSPLNTGPVLAAGAPMAAMQPAAVPAAAMPQHAQPPVAAGLTPEQLAKLRRDLEVVLGNVRVMSEMLTEMVPGQEDPTDLKLLLDLNKTCRAMQIRLVELVSSISNEEVTGELLRVNDDLNNVFVRFDRFERYRQSQTGQPQAAQTAPSPAIGLRPNNVDALPPSYPAATAAPSAQPQPQPQSQPQSATLIDFGSEEPSPAAAAAAAPNAFGAAGPGPAPGAAPGPVTASGDMSQQLAGLAITPATNAGTNAAPTDDFDMFAQSRQTTYTDSRKSGSTYQDILNLDQSGVTMGNLVNARANPFSAAPVARPTQDNEPVLPEEALPPGIDVDEMEQWLQATDLDKEKDKLAAQNTNSQGDPGITSSEFDQFLETRAKAAENLPPNQASQNHQTKIEETENTMFAL